MTTDPKPTSQQETQTLLQVGDAELSLREQTFRLAGREPVHLTPTEFRLLEYLMRHEGIPISGETLADACDINPKHLLRWILRLSERIEPDPFTPAYLHTVPGIGYLFQSPTSPEFPLAFQEKMALYEHMINKLEADNVLSTPFITDLRSWLENTKRLDELYRTLFNIVYSFPDVAEKEGEQHPKQEHQIPAPKQPEEVQKAPSWTAERWQVSSWDAYIYHPEPNGQIAAPVEAEQQQTEAPARPQETTVFTAPEQPTSTQLPPEVQEAATKYENIKGQWRQAGARYRERHPDKIQEIQAQRKEKKREYDRQRYARRKAAREQAQKSSSSEQP